MKTVTFDTYAWVEYFSGTRKGELARDYVESPCVILTPAIALLSFPANTSGRESTRKRRSHSCARGAR